VRGAGRNSRAFAFTSIQLIEFDCFMGRWMLPRTATPHPLTKRDAWNLAQKKWAVKKEIQRLIKFNTIAEEGPDFLWH
jgi:hypothetical protein